MIDNITKGQRIQGLLLYLFGPGKEEEHENPRLVAGWEGMAAPEAGMEEAEVFALAGDMDRPRQVHGRDVPRQYVWHCSLRNHDDDRTLTDAEWGAIARQVITEMGFSECRWVAVRHADNHVHLAVTRVTEGGALVSLDDDYPRMKAVCKRLELAYKLEHTPNRDRGIPGVSRAELERTQRDGLAEPARTGLARKLRAVAAVARTEAEFVARVQQDGLRLRARRDGAGKVVGYAVNDPGAAGTSGPEGGLWFAGSTLAPDLSLPRLRQRWAAIEPGRSDRGDNADGAGGLDAAARDGQLQETSGPAAAVVPTSGTPGPGRALPRPRLPLPAEAWQQAQDVVDDVAARLQAVPSADTAAWAQAAGEVAGILAALSTRFEAPGRPAELARAATAMARAAQTDHMPRTYSASLRNLWGVSRVSADAVLHPGTTASVANLVAGVGRIVDTIHRTHQLEARSAQDRQAAVALEALIRWAANPSDPLPSEAALVLPTMQPTRPPRPADPSRSTTPTPGRTRPDTHPRRRQVPSRGDGQTR